MAREHDDGLFAFLLGMVAGSAAGAVVGLLFAPKSGNEFRNDCTRFIKTLPDKLEGQMEPQSSTRKFIDRTRINIENQVEKVHRDKQARRHAEAKLREEMASGIDY